ncbi:hypothetical protein [Bordetella flabilis]
MEIRSHHPATSYQAATPPQDRSGQAHAAEDTQMPSSLTQWGQALQSPAPLERAFVATIFTGIGP